MGLFKKLKKVVSAPIRTSVDKITNPGASLGRIKDSFRSGNFLDPVAAISQELDPGVGLTHEAFRQGTGQNLDPASKVNQNLSRALGTEGKGYIGNKPAHILGLLATGGGFAAGAGGAAGAGSGAGGASTGVGGLPAVNVGATSSVSPFAAGAGGAGAGGGGGLSSLLSGGNLTQLGGGLLGAAGQYFGNREAARGAQAGIDEIARQYDTNRNDLAPYRQAGTAGLGRLLSLYGINPDGTQGTADLTGLYNSPDYQFARSEGLRGVENSAAASGGLYSGRTLKALQDRGDGLASMHLGDYANRLASIAGIGQTATNTGVAAGQNSAGQIAGLRSDIGNSRASGLAGAGNILANTGSNIAGSYYGNQMPDWYRRYYGGA